MNFNGTIGDTEQITVLIIDDSLYESATENFTIQFTSVTDVSADITDTAMGTINDDEVILNNPNLVLTHELD